MNWVLRNWLILAAYLAALSVLGSYLQGTESRAAVALLLVGWGAAIGLALVDGVRRVLGKPSVLGAERGRGRLLAIVQILLAMALLGRLLLP